MDDLISRQEAIDVIEAGRLTKLIDAETAVNGLKALPSAQPEPTTEIQEILNYLDTTLHPIVSPNNWNVYAELHDMVSKLSSAQPERKMGCWITLDSDSERYEDIKCPFCGHTFTVDAERMCDIGFIREDLNYCPNCGAKME